MRTRRPCRSNERPVTSTGNTLPSLRRCQRRGTVTVSPGTAPAVLAMSHLGLRRELEVGQLRELLRRVAVHGLGGGVGLEHSAAFVVDELHGVRLGLEELPVALLALRPRRLALALRPLVAHALRHVAGVQREAAVAERTGADVEGGSCPLVACVELDDGLLAHGLLEHGERLHEREGRGQIVEVLAHEFLGLEPGQPPGRGVGVGEPPVLADGDEALEAADDPGQEALARLQSAHELLALERLDLLLVHFTGHRASALTPTDDRWILGEGNGLLAGSGPGRPPPAYSCSSSESSIRAIDGAGRGPRRKRAA